MPLASTVNFCIRCFISVPLSFRIEDSGPGSPPDAADAKLLNSVNSVANKSISIIIYLYQEKAKIFFKKRNNLLCKNEINFYQLVYFNNCLNAIQT